METNRVDDEVRAAIHQGIRDAASDPEIHKALIAGFAEAAGKKARDEAGSWVLRTLRDWFWSAVKGGVVIVVLWKLGGLPLVLTWFNGGKS